jgi:thiazole tautomerase (transcriptional regulator TenI)
VTAIPRFVVILDREGAHGDIATVAAAAIRGGADVVQVREKRATELEVAEIVHRVIRAIGDPLQVAVNGFPSIAAEFGTHLHLPEAGVPVGCDIRLAEGALLSRSIHGPAKSVNADYVILGNVMETSSKPGKAGIGFERFGTIARTCPAPVLAIGGMEPRHVADVLRHGGHGVAVRSFVIGSDDPATAARAIRKELEKWAM